MKKINKPKKVELQKMFKKIRIDKIFLLCKIN